jgi:hypothetical protein
VKFFSNPKFLTVYSGVLTATFAVTLLAGPRAHAIRLSVQLPSVASTSLNPTARFD